MSESKFHPWRFVIAVSFSLHHSSSRHMPVSNLRLTHPWLTCFNSCNACYLQYDARSKCNMSESKFHPWRFVIAVSFSLHRSSSRHMPVSNLHLTHPWLTCFNSCNACHLQYDARSKCNMSESKFHPWRFVIAVSFSLHRSSSRHLPVSNLRLTHPWLTCFNSCNACHLQYDARSKCNMSESKFHPWRFVIAVSFSLHRSSSRHLPVSNLRLTHPWLTCFNSCNACHLQYDARSKCNMSESKFHPWRFVIAVSFSLHHSSSRHPRASNLSPSACRQTRVEHAYEVCICDPAWIIHSAVLPRTNTKVSKPML